jgi:hypothetical protein
VVEAKETVADERVEVCCGKRRGVRHGESPG